ncbi:hypothetical protein TrVE_jg7516 [Triparma verrucosa]|uniref:Uncharacterized protein n=1 Tax=Triparma verrucosa TaxID=1606542 RepID=A0A9W7KV20_9STRA|nr:hypothetical protein TrVE_jg7516 [Triparma verrucosa]
MKLPPVLPPVKVHLQNEESPASASPVPQPLFSPNRQTNELLRRHQSALKRIGSSSTNRDSSESGAKLAEMVLKYAVYYCGFGNDNIDPRTKRPLHWFRTNAARTVISLSLIVPLSHYWSLVLEPNPDVKPLWTGFWACIVLNTVFKRQNSSKILDLTSVIFTTLSEDDASAVKKRNLDFVVKFLVGDPDNSWLDRNFLRKDDIIQIVINWLCIYFTAEADTLTEKGSDLFLTWQFYLLFILHAIFAVTALKGAGAMTFILFYTSSVAMEKHCEAYSKKIEELSTIFHHGNETFFEDDVEAPRKVSDPYLARFNAGLGSLMSDFTHLQQLSMTFNSAFEFYFLVAEFTIMPVSFFGLLILYTKISTQKMNPLNFAITVTIGMYTLIYVLCIPFLFKRGSAVTEKLRSVEKRIHLLRSDVMFYDQVNSVNNMSMRTDPKRTWRSLQIDKFHKYVEDSSLSFSPYGITIDGRLALYLFYIIATLVFTVYVEVLF